MNWDEERTPEGVEEDDWIDTVDLADPSETITGTGDDTPPESYVKRQYEGGYDPKNQPGWQIKPGRTVNRLKIVKALVEVSAFYGRAYFTGEVLCECMGPPDGSGCGRQIRVSRQYLHPKRPVQSKYSCGECCTRPRKPYKKNRKKRKVNNGGRKPIDIKGNVYGDLTVIERRAGKGWRVECGLCGGKTIVPRTYQLLRGTITACEGCRPDEWMGKRGPKPKDERRAA